MRIIGGSAGGTILKVPDGLGVRPTPDKVRQAIFNSLGARVDGADVLELFGGTGALSLECLSRGANSVLCAEKSRKHASFIRGNAKSAGFASPEFQLRIADVFQVLHQLAAERRQFDLVLADPPFGEKNVNCRSASFSQKLLDDHNVKTMLTGGGLLVLGHTKRDTLSVESPWCETKILKHGDSVFRMLRLETQVNR